MKYKKRIFTAMAITFGCLALTSMNMGQKANAIEVKIINSDKVSTKYPLGAASDFMMVAGNQFIHGGASFDGRVMANSISLKNVDGLGAPGFDGSLIPAGNTSYDTYFRSLANPAVVINDFLKTRTGLSDGDKKTTIQNSMYTLSRMWQNPLATGADTDATPKSTKFATDTSLVDVEKAYPGLTSTLGGTKTLADVWAKSYLGESGGKLAALDQFKDNGVNQYETAEHPTIEKYSLQENIQDLSNAFGSLTPANGTTTDATTADGSIVKVENRDFWSSTENIVGVKDSINPDGNKTNPVYVKDDNWPDITDVVVNITSKADVPGVSEADKEKALKELTEKKAVVSIPIDRHLLVDANHAASHINTVFNFSDSFYTENSEGKKVLDVKKVPYLIMNYYGFANNQFKFTQGDGFFIGDLQNHQLPNNDSNIGKPGFVRSIALEVGGKDAEDWSNREALRFGSQMLNNFTDATDLDYSDSHKQDEEDNAGLKGGTAAVNFTNRNGGTMLFGSMLIPHGSFYVDSTSHGLFLGGVVAANNITLDNAIVSPEHDKSLFGYDHNFPGLEPAKPDITIDSVDVTDSKTKTNILDGKTATFDYVDGGLEPMPNLNLTGTLNLSNTPDSYGLYYRFNGAGDWQRYGDEAQTGTTVDLSQTLLQQMNKSGTNTVNGPTQTAQKISYQLTRKSSIQFATTDSAAEATIKESDMKSTATFGFELDVKGTLEATVPGRIKFGPDILGQSTGIAEKIVAVNEIQTNQKSVANTGTTDDPEVVIYNPLLSGFNLKLAYLDSKTNSDNPFYMKENYKFSLNGADPVELSSPETDGQWTGILSRDAPQQTVETTDATNLLKSSLKLELPYQNSYKVGEYEAPMGWQLELSN